MNPVRERPLELDAWRLTPGEHAEERLVEAARMRAEAFHAYPPERAYAGKLHQDLMAAEEAARLRRVHVHRAYEDADESLEACFLFYARLDGAGAGATLVGSVDVHASRSDDTFDIANVCVSPRARRRGVARSMVDYAAEAARKRGAASLRVSTLAVNEGAMALYERVGFRLVHVESREHANQRGGCLDGICGEARVATLVKDLLLV